MHCIICREDKDSSPEHVIARALGGSFVIHRLCQKCNNDMGGLRVDQGLIDHNAIVERRVALQLAGNRGTVPDPLGDALRYPVPTEVPGVSIRIRRDENDATLMRGTVVRNSKIAVTDNPDGTQDIGIYLFVVPETDADKSEMYLKSDLRKAGARDEAQIQRVCDEFLPHLESVERSFSVVIPVPQNLGGHYLGMAKIAFEMAHHWLGDAWLDDPIAIGLRAALRGEANPGGRFRIGDDGTIQRPKMSATPGVRFDELPSGYDPDRTNILMLYREGITCCVCMWLLDAFSAMFLVTENAAAYQVPATDSVVMDVIVRRPIELQTVAPA